MFYNHYFERFNRSYDEGFPDLSFDGGGGSNCPPLFLFWKTIEKGLRVWSGGEIFSEKMNKKSKNLV